MIVDPAHRGAGIGRALARYAVLEALELGLQKMVVEVIADQDATIAMFRSLGLRAGGAARRSRPRPGAAARPDGARAFGRGLARVDGRRRSRGRAAVKTGDELRVADVAPRSGGRHVATTSRSDTANASSLQRARRRARTGSRRRYAPQASGKRRGSRTSTAARRRSSSCSSRRARSAPSLVPLNWRLAGPELARGRRRRRTGGTRRRRAYEAQQLAEELGAAAPSSSAPEYEQWLDAHEPEDPGGRGESGDASCSSTRRGRRACRRASSRRTGTSLRRRRRRRYWEFDADTSA